MMLCRGLRRYLVSLLLLTVAALSCGFADPSSSDKKPLIVLTELSAAANDTVAEKLASTITSNIELVMKLTGGLRVQRVDYLLPSVNLARTRQYYDQVNADGAVYGSVTAAKSGEYSIELDVWDAAKPDGPTKLEKIIPDLLSAFSVSDNLSLEVASTVIGHQLSEGTLLVEGMGSLPEYSVYADGHLLGRNETSSGS